MSRQKKRTVQLTGSRFKARIKDEHVFVLWYGLLFDISAYAFSYVAIAIIMVYVSTTRATQLG